jgi:hypothetical protein
MIEKLGRATTHRNICDESDIKGHMPNEMIIEVQYWTSLSMFH